MNFEGISPFFEGCNGKTLVLPGILDGLRG